MGSFARTAGGIGAAMLMGAGLAAAPSAAQAAKVVRVPCAATALTNAIDTANRNSPAVLRLAPHCIYDLTAAYPNSPTPTRGPDGLPIITGNVTLLGGPTTIIRRNTTASPFRIAEVASGGTLRVVGIFISHGNAGADPGGGILNAQGTVILDHVTLGGNTADSGGGLANDRGTVRIYNTHIVGNTTFTPPAGGGGGGGVYNDGTLTAFNTRITTNHANTNGGGILTELGGTSRLIRVTVDHNAAGINGGGVHNGAGGTTAIIRALITLNTAGSATGGGGVHNAGTAGSVTVARSLIRANTPVNCAPTGTVPGCVG
jgi:hypothetical protein